MKKKTRFLKIVYGIFFVTAVFAWNVTSADEGLGISVDNAIFNLTADVGTKDLVIKFNILNNTDLPSKVSIKPFDYTLGDENRVFPLEYYSDNINGLRDWLIVDQSEFVIGAREKKEISVSVSVPQDAIVGSHWGGLAVEFSEVNPQEMDSSSLSVGGRIGVHVLLNVNGETDGSGRLNNLEVPRFVFNSAVFSSEYEDIGNVHYIPHGEISVKNMLSGEIDKIMLDKHFAFPGKKVTYTAQWKGGLSWAGAYSVQSIFVDGSGEAHTQSRYMFGMLFFPFLLLLIASVLFFVRFFKKRK